MPFDNSTNGFVSDNVQEAIEEARASAYANDRYPIGCSYGGNANVGRYLEPFTGLNFIDAPFVTPEDSKIITATLNTVDSSGSFSIGFFKSTDLVNPILTLALNDGVSTQTYSNLTTLVDGGAKILIRVTTGSRLKPSLRVWFNTLGTT